MSTFGKSRGGGRRAAARSSAPLIAVLTTVSESFSALIVDISTTGVRLRSSHLPQMSQEVMILFEEARVFGSVAWSENGECGVEFDAPLSHEDEKRLKLLVSAARDLPPEMTAAFDSWVLGCGRQGAGACVRGSSMR